MTVLALVQGLFYLVTGAWSLVHIESFQWVTGRKTDLWLVKTVGLLLVVVGGGLIAAARVGRFDAPLLIIAVGVAAALMIVDVVYALKGVISRVYLLDAVAEAGLIVAWGVLLAG